MSQYESLRLGTIAKLDQGVIAAAFDAELASALNDCEDRPHTEKPRTITLTIKLTPVPDSSGGMKATEVDFDIKSTRPKQESRTYQMEPKTVRTANGTPRTEVRFLPTVEEPEFDNFKVQE